MAGFMIFWIVCCVAVAVLADRRGRSAVGFLVLSLLLSPFLGAIILYLFKDLEAERLAQLRQEADAAEKLRLEERRELERRAEHQAHVASIQAIAAPRGTPQSVADEIQKLGDLLTKGLLTQDEFDAQKAALLRRP